MRDFEESISEGKNLTRWTGALVLSFVIALILNFALGSEKRFFKPITNEIHLTLVVVSILIGVAFFYIRCWNMVIKPVDNLVVGYQSIPYYFVSAFFQEAAFRWLWYQTFLSLLTVEKTLISTYWYWILTAFTLMYLGIAIEPTKYKPFFLLVPLTLVMLAYTVISTSLTELSAKIIAATTTAVAFYFWHDSERRDINNFITSAISTILVEMPGGHLLYACLEHAAYNITYEIYARRVRRTQKEA